MMRWLIVAVVLMVCSPGAYANSYDTLTSLLGATHYYTMATNANDSGTGAQNGTCGGGGTCTYGNTIATNISGVVFSTTATQITSQAEFVPSSDYTTVWWVKTSTATRTIQLQQLDSGSNEIAGNLANSGFCSGTQAMYRRFNTGIGTFFGKCSTANLGDGAAHMIAIVCNNIALTCQMYIDGVADGGVFTVTTANGHGANALNIGITPNSDTSGYVGAITQFNGTRISAANINNLWLCGTVGTNCTPVLPLFFHVPSPGH